VHDWLVLNHGEVLPHRQCLVSSDRHKLRVEQLTRGLVDLSVINCN
jgi:hypothetical protein